MSKKDLNYFLNLPFTIIIDHNFNDGEIEFVAYCNELGKFSCYGIGRTTEEALKNFHEEKDSFITYLFESNKPIPEPIIENKYSGVFNVRTSPIIHSNLVKQAKENEISLNLYINQILSGYVEKITYESKFEKMLTELCSNIKEQKEELTKQIRYNIDWLNCVRKNTDPNHLKLKKVA